MTKLLTRSAAVGVLAAMMLTGCSSNDSSTVTPKVRATYADGTIGTVKEVKTGNTVSVQLGDQVKDVRLLNVVAPSKTNVEDSGDCLIDDSKKFLANKLPAGTQVTLNFDPTQEGLSGYVDAAVYVGDDFVNKDIVGAGLATTTFSSPKDKFYPEISAAQQQAGKDAVGLYSPTTECTIAHEIQAQIDAVNGASGDDNKKTQIYQKASQLYNRLAKAGESAATWTGSILTLNSTKAKMEELKKALGNHYYNEDGQSAAEVAASASASADSARPDGSRPTAPAESAAPAAPVESAAPAASSAPAEQAPAGGNG